MQQLMASAGFAATDFVALSVAVRGKRATALVVPTRISRDGEAWALVLEVKAQASAARTKVCLLPQRSICSTVRGTVAATIARSKGVRYLARHVDAVIDHVAHARISTFAECANVLQDHDDPFGVLLAMTARGFLDLDRSRPLLPSTWVTTTL